MDTSTKPVIKHYEEFQLRNNILYNPNHNMFQNQIYAMNCMYELPVYTGVVPSFSAILNKETISSRLNGFYGTLRDEVEELEDIIFDATVLESQPASEIADYEQKSKKLLVDIADLLGDVVVYCYSEAAKYGINLQEVLEDAIQKSNATKLMPDGSVLKNSEGKFLKGPNYVAPEETIEQLLFGTEE